MSTLQDDLRNFLLLVPLAASRKEGLPLTEAAELIGGSPEEVVQMVSRAFAIGMPDGSPDELVHIFIENERLYVALPLGFRRPPRLTAEEILAISVALTRVESLQQSRLATATEAVREKLLSAATMRAGHLSANLRAEKREQDESLVSAVEQALQSGQNIVGEYYTATRDSLSRRVLQPEKLMERGGHWYVIAHGKTFRLDRFRSVHVTSEAPTEKDSEFSADKEEHVVVQMPDGTIRKGSVRSRESLLRWCLQEEIRILEPSEVREEIIEMLEKLSTNYL